MITSGVPVPCAAGLWGLPEGVCWSCSSASCLGCSFGVSSSLMRLERTALYDKRLPTFADALAAARKELRSNATFYGSLRESETVKVPRAFVEGLTDAVCYAA